MLRVYHPEGDKTDVDGRTYYADDLLYFGLDDQHGLPQRYRAGTYFILDEGTCATDGVGGYYKEGEARGFHTGERVVVRGKSYAEVWTLFCKMTNREQARAYRARHGDGTGARSGPGSGQSRKRRPIKAAASSRSGAGRANGAPVNGAAVVNGGSANGAPVVTAKTAAAAIHRGVPVGAVH